MNDEGLIQLKHNIDQQLALFLWDLGEEFLINATNAGIDDDAEAEWAYRRCSERCQKLARQLRGRD